MLARGSETTPHPTLIVRQGDGDMERARDPPGTRVNPVIPSLCLKISVAGVGETQALDSFGSRMEPKGVGGSLPRDRHFQTCALSYWGGSPTHPHPPHQGQIPYWCD